LCSPYKALHTLGPLFSIIITWLPVFQELLSDH